MLLYLMFIEKSQNGTEESKGEKELNKNKGSYYKKKKILKIYGYYKTKKNKHKNRYKFKTTPTENIC